MSSSCPYTVAVIFLTPDCNMTCPFCITEDHFQPITPQQLSNLFILLKKEGFQSVVLGGGEPFAWKGDLMAMTQEAKKLGFIVQVGTNAIDLPKGFESIPSIDRYVLPLESTQAKVHNQMRLYKQRHHQIIIETLNTLKAAKAKVTISTIITKINVHELKELAMFLEQLNQKGDFIHAWHLYRFLPQGRGGLVHAPELLLNDDIFENIVEGLKQEGASFPIYKRKDMYASKTVDFFWIEHGRLTRGSWIHRATAGAAH